jgi:hypothetical protein
VQNTCIGSGQMCMQGTQPFGMCTAGKCAGCGGPGEPCCPSSGTPGETRCNDPTTVCQDNGSGIGIGVCAKCGGPDQPCCANNTCASGGCCVRTGSSPLTGRCTAMGVMCPSPGLPAGLCMNGSCGTCGAIGQPCCTGYTSFCSAPGSTCTFAGGTMPMCTAIGASTTCMSGI